MSITNEIASRFDSVTLVVPVDGDAFNSTSIYPSHVRILPLPFYDSRSEFITYLPQIVRRINRGVHASEYVYAMGPNDIGLIGISMAQVKGKKLFASLDTDRAKIVKTRGYSKTVELMKSIYSYSIVYPYIRYSCRSSPVFVTGDMFAGKKEWWSQWVKSTYRSDQVPPAVEPPKIPDVPHVVFAGRLSPEKNVPALLRSLDFLSDQGVSLRCSVIGTGRMEDDLRHQASQLSVDVAFLGQIDNQDLMATRFLGADVLVLPSTEERQGKVLLEAMACSVPVVASNVGGIPTVIRHRKNGLLCDPTSDMSIANAISTALSDASVRNQMIEEGRLYAIRHSLDNEVNRIICSVIDRYVE